MPTQYWVGDFFIDLTRNQITHKMQSKTIPPKALAVLTCLAKNAEKVVSQDTLLNEVWPNTIVTPNTLQRSIAQLRKALGDNSQSSIKTHAKQGYSLECKIRWQSQAADAQEEAKSLSANSVNAQRSDSTKVELTQIQRNSQPPTELTDPKKSSSSAKSAFRLFTLLLSVALLALISINYLAPTQAFTLPVGELRLLTATDNKEFAGMYSPDGEYIVFLRYSERTCISSNIWAKNINTQKETQLTKYMGVYGNLSFSKDGKRLTVIKTENCETPITEKYCYKLMSLDFNKALQAPQTPTALMECKNSRIKTPTWLNNGDIAYLQNTSNRWKLVSYSIAENKSTHLYAPDNANIIDYDYSVTDDLIALTSVHSDDLHYIEMLQPDGQLLSSHQIEYPPEISNTRFIYPNFTPLGEQLIFSTGRQLFTLSYQGKITNISLPLDEPMGSPVFHPNGKRMLVIKGHWDSDIATVSLSKLADEENLQKPSVQTLTINPNSVIERTRLEESNAIYQPQGNLIAFKSARSGEDQIWLADNSGAQQLTHFPIDTFIMGMDWAADGQSILVNANHRLFQVFLNSNQQSVPFDYPIEQLYQWNSEDNSALLKIRIAGTQKFVALNLNDSTYREITDKRVNWALKSEDAQLIYTDHMDRFWQQGPVEEQLIDKLSNQGSTHRFIIKDNVVWGINEQLQLWSYALNNGTFKLIGNVPENIDYIEDINQSEILMTIRISAKKEVAELTIND